MNPEIDALKDDNGQLNEQAIKKIIPYEHPFLFLEKVTQLEKKKIIATKTVTGDEDYIKGHFVGFPIMPGALIVEGMGQAGTLLLRYHLENHQKKEILAYKFQKAKFMYPTLPGDELRFEVTMKGKNDKGAVMKAKAFNNKNDRLITEAKFTLAIVDRERFRAKFSKKQ